LTLASNSRLSMKWSTSFHAQEKITVNSGLKSI